MLDEVGRRALGDVRRLASRQHALVTFTQLQRLGLSIAQVRWLAARSELISFRFQVYRLPGAPVTWDQAVLAAALSAGDGAVISHATAAAVWNLRHGDRYAAGIHLTADRRIRLNAVTGHQARLSAGEQTTRRGIPITTPDRTVLDLAGTWSSTPLAQCVDDAMRRRLVRLEDLRTLVDAAARQGGRRRVKPLQRVLADRIPGYRPDDSDFEAEMNRMWDRLGLSAAVRQHRVVIDGRTYRLDRAIVETKIGTEWDSYRHHSTPSDRDHDSNRRARLVGDGWLIIPVTANSEPELVARAVLRAYRDRGGAN